MACSSDSADVPFVKFILNVDRDRALSGSSNIVEGLLLDATTPDGVKSAIKRMADSGDNIESLRSLCTDRDGLLCLPIFDFLVETFCERAMVSASETAPGGSPLITVQPVSARLLDSSDVISKLDDAAWYVLSPYVAIHPWDGCWGVESPLSPTVITLHDPILLTVLAALSKPILGKALRELSEAAPSRLFLPSLLAADIVGPSDGQPSDGLPHWEYHDLLFHTRSRLGRHNFDYGGTFKGRGVYPAPRAVLSGTKGSETPLPRPNLEELIVTDPPFAKIVEERRSIRSFADAPITIGQVGEFLFRSCRTKAVSTGKEEWQTASRPYPSGGAVYELEVYPLIRECSGLSAGLYYYHPVDHALSLVRGPDVLTERIIQATWYTLAQAGHPHVVFLIAARFDRVFWKYQSMSYALVLKNLGVLYQTMQLTATAMDLASCPLGGGDSDLLAAASGRPYYIEGCVGEFVLGTRAEDVA
jgi:SagB-type dehydrogenase family enzyme